MKKGAYGFFTSKEFVQKIKKNSQENRETLSFGSPKCAFSSSIDGIGHSLYSRAKNRHDSIYLFIYFNFVEPARMYDLHLKCFYTDIKL